MIRIVKIWCLKICWCSVGLLSWIHCIELIVTWKICWKSLVFVIWLVTLRASNWLPFSVMRCFRFLVSFCISIRLIEVILTWKFVDMVLVNFLLYVEVILGWKFAKCVTAGPVGSYAYCFDILMNVWFPFLLYLFCCIFVQSSCLYIKSSFHIMSVSLGI